jgi:2-oxoglutarate ferredoxin oxidoreductase subunit gamma
MHIDVFIAGFGGQGVLLIGNLLAQAALLEGRNVSSFPAYGVEKRGGAATCTVVMADGEVGSPVIGHPGAALILNLVSMEKYFSLLRPGAFCLINSSLVEVAADRGEVEVLRLPLHELALTAGDVRLANMVAIGAYVQRTGCVELDSLKEALRSVLPERKHHYIPLNIRAIDLGAAAAMEGRSRP